MASVRLVALALVAGVAAAAAAPAPPKVNGTNATASSAEQLEQMVSKMASSQDRHVDPPPPRFVDAEQELVILEDDAAQHGRQASGIPACNCNSYVNGAVPFSYACSKQQGATKFCYPAVGLTCNSDMTLCIDPYPSASPGPG